MAFFTMAGMTRLELATSCVTGRHSNQLSYIPIVTLFTGSRNSLKVATTAPETGGRRGARTPDILLVRQALSQLSYSPWELILKY